METFNDLRLTFFWQAEIFSLMLSFVAQFLR